MANKTLLILCFLGDPMLPAVSVPNTGGYNVDIRELLDYLSESEWNCAVITNTSIFLRDRETRWADNIQIYRVPVEDSYVNQQEYLQSIFPAVLEETERLCRENGIVPELIHSHYWFSGYLAKHLGARMGVPFVHSTVSLSMDKINSGVQPRSRIQTDWELSFLPDAKAIFVITAQERDLLLRHYPVDPTRVLIVGRSVPEAFRRPQHDAEGFPPQISVPEERRLQNANRAVPASTFWWNGGAYLFMGRLREIKGVDVIIRAWLRLYRLYQDRVPPLWIAGGEPDAIAELRKLLEPESGILERAERCYKLVWWGYLSPEGISTLLLKSSVLLMHSRFEAGGRIILEAMSSRKPVIATPTGFAKDYILNWRDGFLVEYGDMDALTQKMELFLRQPLLSNAMGNNAYQTFSRMEEQWDCYPRHMRIYRDVSEHPERPIREELRVLPALESVTDFVKRGLLTAYPYHSPDRDFMEKRLSKIAEGPFWPFDIEARSHLWRTSKEDRPCVVKQFYSAINDLAMWNGADISPVLLARDRFERALFSGGIESIVPILNAVPDLYLILMPEMPRLLPSEEQYISLLGLLETVNACPRKGSLPAHPLGASPRFATLSGRWNAMEEAAAESLSPQWKRFWAERSRGFSACRETAEEPSVFCTVYGTSTIRHLCADAAGTPFLYPSDDLYWGERGSDHANLWVEWECTFGTVSSVDTFARYDLVRSRSGLSASRFKSWCLCVLCRRVQRTLLLGMGTARRPIALIDALLDRGADGS